jgi:hypothetical protein
LIDGIGNKNLGHDLGDLDEFRQQRLETSVVYITGCNKGFGGYAPRKRLSPPPISFTTYDWAGLSNTATITAMKLMQTKPHAEEMRDAAGFTVTSLKICNKFDCGSL